MIKRSQNKWIAHQRISDKGEINLLCFVFAGGSYIHKEKKGLVKICLNL